MLSDDIIIPGIALGLSTGIGAASGLGVAALVGTGLKVGAISGLLGGLPVTFIGGACLALLTVGERSDFLEKEPEMKQNLLLVAAISTVVISILSSAAVQMRYNGISFKASLEIVSNQLGLLVMAIAVSSLLFMGASLIYGLSKVSGRNEMRRKARLKHAKQMKVMLQISEKVEAYKVSVASIERRFVTKKISEKQKQEEISKLDIPKNLERFVFAPRREVEGPKITVLDS